MFDFNIEKDLIKNLGIGIWRWELDKGNLFWNDNMFKIYDVDKKDFTGKVDFFYDLILDKDKKSIENKIKKSIINKEIFEAEFRIKRKDNSIRTIYARGYLSIKNDEIKNMYGLNIDVTQYGSIQDKVDQMTSQIDCAIKSGVIGFWTWDIKSNKTYGDEKMYEVFPNYNTFEGFLSSIHPDDRDLVLKENNMNKIIKNNCNYKCLYRAIKDGKIININAMGRLHLDEYGCPNYMSGIILDETENLKTIKELENKNNDLERFSFIASHDLQEPLRKIRSYIDLEKKRKKEDSFYLDRIEIICKNMQNFIHDISNYNTLKNDKNIKNEIINLKLFLENFSNLRNANINIDVDEDVNLIIYKTDLEIIFNNLISNSIKFKKENKNKSNIKIESKIVGNFCLIEYTDDGIGIDPRFIGEVFDLFSKFHSKTKYPGNGLGMHIVKETVKKYGGEIIVESKLGEGVVFKITLPRKINKEGGRCDETSTF